MKKMAFAAAMAAVTGIASAEEPQAAAGWNWTPGEGISFNERAVMTAEFSLGFDSKYMTYGVVDGKDPILVPGATATFFDWAYIGVESIFDTTKGNGKGGGYGNRAGEYTTLDAFVGLAHELDLGEKIGTLGIDFGYMYQYIPRYQGEMGDTQYLTLEVTLGGHWIEPTLSLERDIMADDGTYANLALGHTFELTENLSVCPSIAQGIGDSKRTSGYFNDPDVIDGFDRSGLMDTSVRVDFEYALTDWLSLGAYVAYYDYLFDSRMRDAAKAYNATWGSGEDKSWNFVGGLSLTATF